MLHIRLSLGGVWAGGRHICADTAWCKYIRACARVHLCLCVIPWVFWHSYVRHRCT